MKYTYICMQKLFVVGYLHVYLQCLYFFGFVMTELYSDQDHMFMKC